MHLPPLPLQDYDGYRGENGIGGWWISLVSAQKRCVGQERWWTKADQHGRVVPVQPPPQQPQQPAPSTPTTTSLSGTPPPPKKSTQQLPIWLFSNGDMYLGEWKEHGPKKHAVEHGFGISYIFNKPNQEGLVYIGRWKNGYLRDGFSFWLESSSVWMENRLAKSELRDNGGNIGGRPGRQGIPFTYAGRFRNGFKSDLEAVVTLKDGSTRKGPWAFNKPVGSWYNHQPVSVAAKIGRLEASSRHEEDEGAGSKRKSASDSASSHTKKKAASSRSLTSRNAQNATLSTVARGAVAIKQEPQDDEADVPEVIELLDSSSEAPEVTEKQEPVEEEEPQADVAANNLTNLRAMTPTAENDAVDPEDEARIQKICDWLEQDDIGNNPKPGNVKMYASSLYELGFESVEMMTNTKYLTERQVDSFAWMKPLHKQMLLDFLYGSDA